MARTSLPVLPFPANIDRQRFGHWISGFTDGEGHFALIVANDKRTPAARFVIGLRADDLPALRLIQSYWGCGTVFYKPKTGNTHEQYFYHAVRIADLVSVVIPHFQTFPLRAKKRNDFLIWKEAVSFVDQVIRIPLVHLGGKDGSLRRWTPERMDYFRALMNALKVGREYQAPPVPLPPPPPLPPPEPGLFD